MTNDSGRCGRCGKDMERERDFCPTCEDIMDAERDIEEELFLQMRQKNTCTDYFDPSDDIAPTWSLRP